MYFTLQFSILEMKGCCYKTRHYILFNRKDEQIKSPHRAMTFLFRQTAEKSCNIHVKFSRESQTLQDLFSPISFLRASLL